MTHYLIENMVFYMYGVSLTELRIADTRRRSTRLVDAGGDIYPGVRRYLRNDHARRHLHRVQRQDTPRSRAHGEEHYQMALVADRRKFLIGALVLVTAPAIVRVQSIMPVRTMLPVVTWTPGSGFIRPWQDGVSYVAGDVALIDSQPYVCTYGVGPACHTWEALVDQSNWVRSARLMRSDIL